MKGTVSTGDDRDGERGPFIKGNYKEIHYTFPAMIARASEMSCSFRGSDRIGDRRHRMPLELGEEVHPWLVPVMLSSLASPVSES